MERLGFRTNDVRETSRLIKFTNIYQKSRLFLSMQTNHLECHIETCSYFCNITHNGDGSFKMFAAFFVDTSMGSMSCKIRGEFTTCFFPY